MTNKLHELSLRVYELSTLCRGAVVVVGAVLLALLDVLTPPYVPFTGYYFVPVFLSIWFFSCTRPFVLVLSIALGTRLYVQGLNFPQDSQLWEQLLAAGSTLVAFLSFSALVFYLKRYVAQALELSDKDPLTGLRNLRGFMSLAEHELKRRNRVRYPLTIAMMDLDCFKLVNDTHGHPAGDKLLIDFSECLVTTLRNVDIIGRVGGDEFALMLPNTNLQDTELVLERLHSNLQPLFQRVGCKDLGCSIGAVNVQSESCGGEITEFLKKADTLLYEVKHASKNAYVIEAI